MHVLLLAAALAGGPIQFDDLGGVLVVKASVNGTPLNLVLDTGAGTTIIAAPAALEKLKLAESGSKTLHNTGKRDVTAANATLATVSVGDAVASNVAAVVTTLPPDLTYQGRYGTIDGILGYTFLKNFAVTVDYDARSVEFTKSQDFHSPKAATAVPM